MSKEEGVKHVNLANDRSALLEKINLAKKEIEDSEGIDWEDVKKEMDLWLE